MFLYPQANMIDTQEDLHIARMYDRSDCKHMHDFLELVFVEHGIMFQIVDDKLYKISSGTMLICLPGQAHSFFTDSEQSISYINILIRMPNQWTNKALADALENFTNVFQRQGQVPLLWLDESQSVAYGFHILEMLKLYDEKPPKYKCLLREQLIGLLIAGTEQRKCHQSEDAANRNLSERVLETLERSFTPEKTLNDLAEDLSYDAGYLTKSFKKHYGLTITEYIQQTRIDMARYLLWATDLPIEEISKTVGYSNKTFFYKIFTRATGMTPSEVRKVYRKMARRFLDT